MKICIIGAGAIGGMLAVRLADSGAKVSVVARGTQLAAIRAVDFARGVAGVGRMALAGAIQKLP